MSFILTDMAARSRRTKKDAIQQRAIPYGFRAIYGRYLRVRIEADLEVATRVVVVRSGPLIGQRFASPSAAAAAVVESLNSDRVSPNTNGRIFWHDRETGRAIGETIIRY